jgi:hypothetical protein
LIHRRWLLLVTPTEVGVHNKQPHFNVCWILRELNLPSASCHLPWSRPAAPAQRACDGMTKSGERVSKLLRRCWSGLFCRTAELQRTIFGFGFLAATCAKRNGCNNRNEHQCSHDLSPLTAPALQSLSATIVSGKRAEKRHARSDVKVSPHDQAWRVTRRLFVQIKRGEIRLSHSRSNSFSERCDRWFNTLHSKQS